MGADESKIIGPQAGPQTAFLSSPADIAIYGGSAGGGKSFALLLDPLRFVANGGFGAVIFRRTSPQITNEGALWDESTRLYPFVGAEPRVGNLDWRFPSGATVAFAHMQHEQTKLDWQGSQIPMIGFDELTHFSKGQFFYMMSRNRSMCGVRPYIRATCNPDADSWVAGLISWWIDPDSGFPIAARAGVLRYFVRINDALVWADSREELLARHPGVEPKSLTFIPAKLSDNQALMRADPGYLASLMALPTVDRERLLNGNWKIRPASGLYFKRGWVRVVDALPEMPRIVRGWDLAATPKTEHNEPDWTAGTKVGRAEDGRFFVLDHVWERGAPGDIDALLKRTAALDGTAVEISLPQDPGQAGKSQAAHHAKLLAGYTVRSTAEPRRTGDAQTASAISAKVTRFGPFSAQAQAGNVFVLRGEWNERWFSELEAFPEARHDDDADATSRAFNAFLALMKGESVFELERREALRRAEAEAPPEPSVPQPAPGSLEWMQALAGP